MKSRWPALGIKIVGSAGLLTWLLRKVDWEMLIKSAARVDIRLLTLAFGLLLVYMLVGVARYSILLKSHSRFRLTYPLLARYCFISAFFSTVLPGTISGDVVRSIRVNRHGRNLAFTLQSLFLERYLGAMALLTIALTALRMAPLPFSLGRSLHVLVILFALGLIVPIAILARAYRWTPLPQAWKENFDLIRASTMSGAFALSLVLQGLNLGAYLLVGSAVGMTISVSLLAPLVLLTSLAAFVPISISGLGVNENIFVHGLTMLGYPMEYPLLMSLLYFLLNVSIGMLGGIIFLLEKKQVPAGSDGARSI